MQWSVILKKSAKFLNKDEPVRIPSTDKWLGSCPECGKPVWESYLSRYKTLNTGTGSTNQPQYRCIECQNVFTKDELIPF
jgi:hypothetical protein